jgi:glycosyltransferase involved in cell wall biosynthesis
MAALMQTAIVTLVPALWYENLPNALIESLAAGAPVIASNLGSLRSAVRHGVDGLLFETGNAASLAQSIGAVLDDDGLWNDLSQNAFLAAQTVYSPHAHMDALLQLFEDTTERVVSGRTGVATA